MAWPTLHDAGHGFDVFGASATWVRRLSALASPLYERWFRVESHGGHHIPRSGPAILAANHSGTLPFDAVMLWADALRQTRPPRVPRAIADHFVQGLPFVGKAVARGGAVPGTRDNLRHLLEQGELLLIFPEGVPGIGKGFRRRYQLAPFRVGHVELAIRHRAPVIPTALVGAEEQMPQLGRLPLRAFGIPYLPLAVPPFPLPVRYHVYYGEPIALHELFTPEQADHPEILDRAALIVKRAVEDLIQRGLAERRGIFR